MTAPETRYARSGDVSIAYQVVGDGPFDVVLIPAWVSHVELAWTNSPLRHYMDRLASVARLIVFDKRGTGMSDRAVEAPDLETRMDDVRAVMDAAGSGRAAIIGASEGAPMSILFAATHPRTDDGARPPRELRTQSVGTRLSLGRHGRAIPPRH